MKNLLLLVLVLVECSTAVAQDPFVVYAKSHRGNALYVRFGIHNGNRAAITFRNSGQLSGTDPNDIRGAWPYPATEDSYIGDVTPLVGVELPGMYPVGTGSPGTSLRVVHSVTISPGPRNGQAAKVDPNDGHFQGFMPELGYLNLAQDTVAMSNVPGSWPSYWPDHPDWLDPISGKAVWNSYFGKGVMINGQESYFVMDDAQDNSVQARTSNLFHPDSTDTTRNGVGLVVKVRGFQFSEERLQDAIVWLYQFTNIGTTSYRRVVFGTIVGGCVGDVGQNYVDCQDDLGFFDVNNGIAYTWDSDDRTSDLYWIPLSAILPGATTNIGYAGYAFLETPGNSHDGIDNDNDAVDPGSPKFQESDFTYSSATQSYSMSRTLSRSDTASNPNWPADEIILIDPASYNRTVVRLDTLLKSDADTAYVSSLGVRYKIYGGETLSEISNNGLDDNLNGLIDEDRDIHYERVFKTTLGVIYKNDLRPLAYKNYFSGEGLANTMIDESRDSGPGTVVTGWVPDYSQPRNPATGEYPGMIKSHWSGDENGNWDVSRDDVGSDGLPNTHDAGEGDGMPGKGEPHFDGRDPQESDQIGLTSFNFFNQTASPAMNNSETLWSRMTPGYFDVIPALAMDGDFIFSSGYFSLLPLENQQASLALIFGQDSSTIFYNKQAIQTFYDSSYTNIPTAINQDHVESPFMFSLSQNYPNPFNPVTTIHYTVAKTGTVTLKVYDVLGREVITLVNERKAPGAYTISFDGTKLASGVYFYEIVSGSFAQVKKMILMK